MACRCTTRLFKGPVTGSGRDCSKSRCVGFSRLSLSYCMVATLACNPAKLSAMAHCQRPRRRATGKKAQTAWNSVLWPFPVQNLWGSEPREVWPELPVLAPTRPQQSRPCTDEWMSRLETGLQHAYGLTVFGSVYFATRVAELEFSLAFSREAVQGQKPAYY